MSLEVKLADHADEFEQIAQLNYATFVEEIPQHTPNSNKRLVDFFHAQNRYLICKDEKDIVGMLAIRNQRPFSLDHKLADLDRYLTPGESLCEIRLLSIQPSRRYGRVFALLMRSVFAYCIENGFEKGLISGRIENIPIYEKLGFRSFGPLVGVEGAKYQPMYITPKLINAGLHLMPSIVKECH